LWASGWVWNLTRWMAVFLSSYLVNQRTGSPEPLRKAHSCSFSGAPASATCAPSTDPSPSGFGVEGAYGG
jgi:hypothetical protein